MLTGKTPRSRCFPAGRSDHWLGKRTEPPACIPGSMRAGSSPAATLSQLKKRAATGSTMKDDLRAIFGAKDDIRTIINSLEKVILMNEPAKVNPRSALSSFAGHRKRQRFC